MNVNANTVLWVAAGGVFVYGIYKLQNLLAGSGPKDLKITRYENLSTNVSVNTPTPLAVGNSDTVRVHFQYSYKGDLSGAYRVYFSQIGLLGIDEIGEVVKPFNISGVSGTIQDYVDLNGGAISGGKSYGLQMKIQDIPGSDVLSLNYRDVIQKLDVRASLDRPVAQPERASPGPVQIKVPITLSGTFGQPVILSVTCEVFEGSILPWAGTRLWTSTRSWQFLAGDVAYEVAFNRNSVATSTDRRDVGITVKYGNAVLASGQWDDVYYVI